MRNNEVLYKYYSELPISYFDEPNLKISPPETLNDPFESTIPYNLKILTPKDTKDIHELGLTKNGKPRDSGILVELINDIEYHDMLKSIGVISLSETPRNLLMWAHYANNHRGFCIGYDSNLLNEESSLDERLPISTRPVKIMYDNCRFDFANTSFDMNSAYHEKLKSILYHVLTTKSDEWIYEKECRMILPLNNCDKLIYSGSDETIKCEIDSLQPKNSKRPYALISDDKDFIFAKIIDKKSIKSIYLGCRMDEATENLLLKKICSDESYHHVKIYKYTTSPNKFGLESQYFNPELRNEYLHAL